MFKKFGFSLFYLAALGAVSFVVGRALPKRRFHGDALVFRSRRWEREGKIYDVLRVRSWKDKMPDMSRITPKLMPPRMTTHVHGPLSELERLVQETCVAEVIHTELCVMGFVCILIWPAWPGVLISLVYFAVNLLYVVIQRYNRPRLMRILQKRIAAEERKRNECVDFVQ